MPKPTVKTLCRMYPFTHRTDEKHMSMRVTTDVNTFLSCSWQDTYQRDEMVPNRKDFPLLLRLIINRFPHLPLGTTQPMVLINVMLDGFVQDHANAAHDYLQKHRLMISKQKPSKRRHAAISKYRLVH